jgi:hypothetical protein
MHALVVLDTSRNTHVRILVSQDVLGEPTMATEPIGFLPVPKTMKELELAIQPPTQFTIDPQTIIFILSVALVLMAVVMLMQSMQRASR